MKKYTLFLFVFFCSLPIWSQSQMAKFYYDKGKELYDEKEYEEAIAELEKALEKDETHAKSLQYLGYCYFELDKHAKAVEVNTKLESLVDENFWAWYLYLRGLSNIELGNYTAAVEDFDKFQNRYSTAADRISFHHKAAYKKHYATMAKEVRNLPPKMSPPVNLGKRINTISDDMMPQIDPLGTKLYFTSSRKGGMDELDEEEEYDWGEDLYFIEKSGNKWGSPILLPEPINSFDNDGTSTFSADGQQMVYAKCNDDGGIGSCDLWASELSGTEWSKPFNLGNVINTEKWESQPSLSADGQTLAFISLRDDSYDGSMDVYISRKNQFGQWGPAQNAGPTVNTPFGEKSPYLAPDGKTMYFSSQGHPGFGGYDIFMTVWEGGKWSEPINLGAPLNSKGEDTYFSISASGEGAYFASDRSGEGKLDIFSIEVPEALKPKPSVIIKGIVTDNKSGAKIDAWVLVEDINTGELIATAKSNSVSGEYLVVLPSGRNYSVSANKEGYFFYSNKFEVPEKAIYEEIKRDITLKPIEKGARVVLNNIFFETGKATLTQESYIELGKAVALLNANKKMVVEVGGHTDNVGSDEANMKLSHERAKAVRTYLVKAGIAAVKMQSKGYGETQPVADNETEVGRKANRRTEFVILEN